MYIDMRYPIQVEMNGRVKQKEPWHSGRTLGANLLIYVLGGELSLRIENEEYNGGAGSVFLVPAGVNYAPTRAKELEYIFFHFKTADIDSSSYPGLKIAANVKLPEGEYAYTYSTDTSPLILVPTFSETADDRRIRELIDRIAALNVWSSAGEKLLLDCYLREFLVLLSCRQKSTVSRNLGKILQYIENNYSKEVSLGSLSQIFGFSTSYIARLFKNELKMHSSDYVNRVRVASACDLLANSDLSIGQISERVGFSEQYYFSRIFRHLTGTTPTEFRKNRNET